MTFSFSRLRVAAPLLALALAGAGCFDTSTPPTGPDGGVWKTSDKGVTWVNKKAFIGAGPKLSATGATFDVLELTLDPQDHRAIYLATSANGLEYSLDGGDSWQQAKIPGAVRVNSVTVDAKNKCVVYATSGNHIYKTDDCSRDWKEVFFGARTDVSFTKIVADWYNPTILYVGTSDGDIFRSSDSGVTWTKAIRADGVPITSLVLDPRDSRIVYAGTQGAGILKTEDSGTTWTQVYKQFGADLTDARRVLQVVPDPVEANLIYIVSKYGILKSPDKGETWTALQLTTPPGSIKINAMAIDPKNNKNIVFTGVSTLQFTTDGGGSWSPKRLPTTQTGSTVLIDPIDSNTIYLGTTPPPQKN